MSCQRKEFYTRKKKKIWSGSVLRSLRDRGNIWVTIKSEYSSSQSLYLLLIITNRFGSNQTRQVGPPRISLWVYKFGREERSLFNRLWTACYITIKSLCMASGWLPTQRRGGVDLTHNRQGTLHMGRGKERWHPPFPDFQRESQSNRILVSV